MLRFTLRLTDELAQALKQLAEKEHRSLHAQVVFILEKYIEDYLKNTQD